MQAQGNLYPLESYACIMRFDAFMGTKSTGDHEIAAFYSA